MVVLIDFSLEAIRVILHKNAHVRPDIDIKSGAYEEEAD
jgi:hypothetical protein